jgi:hypothetical protein
MFTGQLSWTDPFGRARQLVPGSRVVNGDGSEAAFALLFTEVLALTDELGAETGQSGLPPDFGNYGGPSLASGPVLGSRLLSQSSAAYLTLPAQIMNNSVTVPDVDTNLAAPNLAAGLNRDKLASWMDAHALACSNHHCALFCRLGMEAAGMSTADRPLSGDAADYGPFLLRHGAHVVPLDSYTPQVGDTVVFDKTARHPNGHMEMYDGHHWVACLPRNRCLSGFGGAMKIQPCSTSIPVGVTP